MTNCTIGRIDLTSCQRRLVQTEFSGGDITSDGGDVFLREMDQRLQLTASVAEHLSDSRRQKQRRFAAVNYAADTSTGNTGPCALR